MATDRLAVEKATGRRSVREKLRAHPEVRPDVAVAAVFRLLDPKVTEGEIRGVKSLLPADFALHWSHEEKRGQGG